jgi:hypothetical protein
MATGVCGGTLLAITCKENGALLPLVVLIAEFTLFTGQPRSRAYWIWLAGTVLLPLTLLFGYIAYNFTNWILPGYALRDYTVTERLLTEARVLSEYLFQVAFPQPSSLGLFHDDYPVSRSLADPIVTAPATLFVVGLCAAAIALRRRMPALSMGVLWYFGAQLLESGPVPLELYFEHRNYFPLAGLLIGVGVQLTLAVRSVPPLRRYSRYVALAAFGWLATLAGVSYGEISLWADPYAQAGAWATERPDSVRAQSHWASVLGEMRFSEGSEDVYDGLTARDPGFRLVAISKNCLRGGVRFREGYDEILARMRTMRFSRTVIGALESLANATEAGHCREAASLFFEPTVAVLLDNPNFASRRFHLFVLQGRYRTAEGRYAAARQDFLAALSARPDVEVALLVVKSAYLGGDQSQGRTDLERARAVNALNRVSRWTYARDIEDWAVAIESMQPNLGTGEKDGGGGGDPAERPRGNHSNGAARQRQAD